MMRSALLTGASLLLTAVVIGNAYFQRQQFYPSVVYITKSNPSMAVIYVQAFVFVILFGKLMRKIFFGSLRAAEFEHLLDRSWYAVTETCLAFTVFKDDFSPKFVALFTILLFLKSFHWLAEDRVDYMERSPSISMLFHVRVISLALLLAVIDLNFIMHAYQSTLSKGASVQLVFGFEYAILLTIVANTIVKYILHSIDLYSENPWENKAVFMLYTELVIGLFKVILYGLFIIIMVRIYTLPLFAVRPMYLTARAFKKAFNDVILSRRAIHNMNTWYPDATPEELENTDNICIICREEMVAPSTKKLPCGHIFHKNCLRSWFQRQQTCPTCRLDVLRAPLPGQQPPRRITPRAQAPPAQQAQQAAGGGGGAQQPQPQVNVNQMFAQLMAANARLQFPPGPPPNPTVTSSSNGQTSSTTTSSTTTNTTATGSNGFIGATTQSNSFPPPFPPPFFMPPFSIPPPLPPQNFAGLTDDELKAMEGHERANVEARIKCLRNIQVLLDAAVMEMQQYSSVVSQLDMTSLRRSEAMPRSSSSNSNAVVASTPPSTASSSSSPQEPLSQPTSETGARPKVKPEKPKEDNNCDSSETTNDEQDEVRKRRLERFGAQVE
eukprot:09345.XXX_221603_219648_1 [CDS] Oithona nana genome sequencing.